MLQYYRSSLSANWEYMTLRSATLRWLPQGGTMVRLQGRCNLNLHWNIMPWLCYPPLWYFEKANSFYRFSPRKQQSKISQNEFVDSVHVHFVCLHPSWVGDALQPCLLEHVSGNYANLHGEPTFNTKYINVGRMLAAPMTINLQCWLHSIQSAFSPISKWPIGDRVCLPLHKISSISLVRLEKSGRRRVGEQQVRSYKDQCTYRVHLLYPITKTIFSLSIEFFEQETRNWSLPNAHVQRIMRSPPPLYTSYDIFTTYIISFFSWSIINCDRRLIFSAIPLMSNSIETSKTKAIKTWWNWHREHILLAFKNRSFFPVYEAEYMAIALALIKVSIH